MNAQGTTIVDTSYFDNLTAQVNAINLCADLQAFINDNMPSIQVNVTAIQAQIKTLSALTSPPTSLSGCIAWITAQIAPYEKAYATATAQLTATLAAIAKLTAAIEAAAARMESCRVTIPPIITTT